MAFLPSVLLSLTHSLLVWSTISVKGKSNNMNSLLKSLQEYPKVHSHKDRSFMTSPQVTHQSVSLLLWPLLPIFCVIWSALNQPCHLLFPGLCPYSPLCLQHTLQIRSPIPHPIPQLSVFCCCCLLIFFKKRTFATYYSLRKSRGLKLSLENLHNY